MSTAEITTIIRIHSMECCAYLRRALLSIVGQSIETNVIIVCQNFSQEEILAVEAFAASYRFGSTSSITIKDVSGESGIDLRAKLLNEGVKATTSRYIHFLDYDDIIYPNAFEILIGALRKSSAAIAFGGITSTFYETIGRAPYVTGKRREFVGESRYELYVRNFCPLHSFVIDMSRCDAADIRFDETMSALEDYNFLLQFVANHKSDFSQINVMIGEYYRRELDTIQSAGQDYPDTSLRLSRLEAARELVEQRKREMITSVRLSEFAWIMKLPVQRQTTELTTSKSAQDNEPNPKLHQTAVRFLYNNCSAELDDSVCRVEKFSFSENSYEVSGWLDDANAHSETSSPILITSDGLVLAEAARFDRQDVREHFSSEFRNFGFYFRFDGMDGMYDKDDFKVVIVNSETSDVMCVPKRLP